MMTTDTENKLIEELRLTIRTIELNLLTLPTDQKTQLVVTATKVIAVAARDLDLL